MDGNSADYVLRLQHVCHTIGIYQMHTLTSAFVLTAFAFQGTVFPQTWTADNGNGTYTNPLFYDEFSDPDMIRVGADFYRYLRLDSTTRKLVADSPGPLPDGTDGVRFDWHESR